nr:hypothetical protein [Tanacetum cinerariifolium]
MVEETKLDEDKEGKAVDPSHYRGMISTLLYLTASRPDLQFAICMCARYQVRPTEKHLHAMRITLVVKIHAVAHLVVCNSWEIDLLAGRQKDKKVLQYPVRKLNTSPYPAVVLKSSGCDYNLPTMALDSTKFQCTVITKALLPYAVIMSHSKSKHIDIEYHFINEHVENGVIEVYFVNTEYQLTDLFTKALDKERIELLIYKLGMRSFTPETLKQLTDEVDE